MKEELIKSAVSFLSSANVKTADRFKKAEFLRKKGLNDQEIEEAFKRVEPLLKQTTAEIPRLPPRITYNPTKIVYYPPAPILRMTNGQLLRYVLSVGLGSFAITVTLVSIVKKYMSNLFDAIAGYQSNRYRQHTHLLNRIGSTLSHSTKSDDLKMAQETLDSSLDRLSQSVQRLQQERDPPYKSLRLTLKRLINSLSNNTLITNSDPRNQFNYQKGLAASYADHYQADANHSLIVQNIKSEIRSIKGSLLSRRNFPIVATASPSSPSPLTVQGFIPPPPTIVQNQSAYHPRIGRSSFRSEKSTNVQETSP
ncbi:hypothetical protein BD408DRAFT_365377 [Parasitella parasitica]|nr:hypothetical protein BD408DRAFT_365377 [Parasitella parasitica]